MEKTKPVGIWLRVSTEDQARGESPEHHEKRARFYAESKSWHEIIGEPTIADAICDRIIHSAYRIELKGESVRKKYARKLT